MQCVHLVQLIVLKNDALKTNIAIFNIIFIHITIFSNTDLEHLKNGTVMKNRDKIMHMFIQQGKKLL